MVEEPLNNQSLEGFILKDIPLSCPECQCSFTSPSVHYLPPVTEFDTVEADLHRVLPDAELRGALIAVCPHCNYATWTVRFRSSTLNPEMLPDAPQMAHSKKFAFAVKHARERGVSPLDIAFIALNGLYCARESGEESGLWLELSAYEQSRGIAEESTIPANAQDYLIMGELYRQLGSFDLALEHYAIAAKMESDDSIPKELLEQQTRLAKNGNTLETVLPPYMVREIFPESANFVSSLRVGKNGRPIPPNVIRHERPDRLGIDVGPPERRPVLSSVIEDQVVDETVKIELEAPIPAAAETAVLQPVPVQPAAVEQAPVEAKSAPAGTVAPAKAADNDSVPINKVRQSIAQPQGGSAIYLVQAAQVPQLNADGGDLRNSKNGNGNGKGKKKPAKPQQRQENPLPPMEAPTNEYFAGAGSPTHAAANPSGTPTQRAVSKALREQKEPDTAHSFPDIQLTDDYADDENYEAAYDYTANDEEPPAQQGSEGGSKSDFSDAIAQVESFLSLTRQSSYQSWIRKR